MEQVSENVVVYYPGDPVGDEATGTVKIALMGSSSYDPSGAHDWERKFIEGVKYYADRSMNSTTGLVMFKNLNYSIICGKAANPIQNPQMDPNNPEFITKMSSNLDFCDAADGIIFNFLKKSQSPTPLMLFGHLVRTGKMICKCPQEYFAYPLIKLMCERYQIPLYPGKMVSVLLMLQGLFTLPSFQQVQQFNLPE